MRRPLSTAKSTLHSAYMSRARKAVDSPVAIRRPHQASFLRRCEGEDGLAVEHRQHKGLNNRAENSHQPTRRRELTMKRFKSAGQARRFLSSHDQVVNLFRLPYPVELTRFGGHL
jgi:putative transposase